MHTLHSLISAILRFLRTLILGSGKDDGGGPVW
jgi:hypothetical protein